MNRMRHVVFTASVILLLLLDGRAAFSQQPQPSSTGLILEVTFYSGRPPAYLPVPGPDSKPNGAWYALFRPVPSWQPPAGFLPVKAVNILSRLEGDAVRVSVSVFVGVKEFEKEEPVATYMVREDEKVVTDALKKFGVEPFGIMVSRVSPISTNLPQVVNKTDSIAVLNIEANGSTLPSYKLQLRNLSGKNVVAMGINVLVDGRERMSAMPQGKEGQPLIAANSTHELNVSAAHNAQMTLHGYAPDSPPNQEILIKSVVFGDGSYEGDAKIAAPFRAFTIGRKIQIEKVVPLIKDALNELEQAGPQAIEKFKTRLASLSNNVDVRIADRLREEFPSLDEQSKTELTTSIEVALSGVKFDLLKSLQEMERANSQPPDANAFRAWLSKTKERYEKWLSLL